MKMSEGENPIPVPRPRQTTKSVDETDRSSKVYENYVLPTLPSNKIESVYDNLNAQLSELRVDDVNRPVPTPRARNTSQAQASVYENAPDTAIPLNNQQRPSPDVARTTGAIRKAPNIPSVKNNFDNNEAITEKAHDDRSLKDFDVLSQTSSASGKSTGDSKFSTPSPGLKFLFVFSNQKFLER